MLSDDTIISLKSELLDEWDYEKNDKIGMFPDSVKPHSNKKAWWKCNCCGFEWEATINNRSNGRSCPKCAQEKRNARKRKANAGKDDLLTLYPEIAATWNYEKNTEYTPSDLKPHSEVKVWWKCEKGHEWLSTISNRTHGNGCPICSNAMRTSLPEQAVFYYICKGFNAQSRIKVAGWEVDILLPEDKIAIEYDGRLYHSSKESRQREERKNNDLANGGYQVIRIKENKKEDKQIGNCIYYIIESNYLHLEYAINAVIKTISQITGVIPCIDVNFKRDRLEIVANYKNIEKANSLAEIYPQLAEEWDTTKNGGLTPDLFSSGSGESVWWVCEKGHSYQSIIQNRTKHGTGCPYCAGKQTVKGETDLETRYPQIAKEWDYEKNDPHSPDEYLPASGKKVWWKCEKGHEYQAAIYSRSIDGTGCPYCSGKKLLTGFNDLRTLFPEIASEWNTNKNGDLTPDSITAYNKRKVWWICPLGHEYYSSIISRTHSKSGCPYCTSQKVLFGYNDLQTLYPQIASEWDYELNSLLPSEVSKGSGKKVWWKCKTCGKSYAAIICNRTGRNTGCPYCAGSLRWEKRRHNKDSSLNDSKE